MKVAQFNDPSIGGILVIDTDLPFNTANGYVQFDVIRPTNVDLTNTLGFSVSVTKSGDTVLRALFNNVWNTISTFNVPGPSHLTITRSDVFDWEVTVRSGTNAVYTKSVMVNQTDDYCAVSLGDSHKATERNATVGITLYANGMTDMANLSIRAEKDVW